MADEKVVKLVNTEINIRKVKVTGLKRTKNDIVTEQVKDILKATTLQDLLARSLESVDNLYSLNAFKKVELILDTSKDSEGNGDGVEVTFAVKESGLVSSSLSANAGTQSGDANLNASLKNVFGRAEQLRMLLRTEFPHWGQTVQLEYSKPYYKDLTKKLNVSIGSTSVKQPSSGYQEHVIGHKLEYKWLSWLGDHSLSWLCDWRELYGFDNGVPLDIRHDAGHTMKSSIKHVMEIDERDDPLLPSNGYHTKSTQEVAGLGGNVFFSKAEIQSAWYKRILSNYVLGLSLWCGLMKPFNVSKINDRFLLGGPTTIRGFEMWGVGPRVQGYAYGGEVYWAAGLHLFSPLPYLKGQLFQRIRIHGFLNAGNLIQYKHLLPLRNLIKDTRASIGIGLHCRLGVAQIEINYALPLIAQSTDWLKPGLQFGIGIDML